MPRLCIYDATHGSLRLTQQLGERFDEVIALAIRMATTAAQPDSSLVAGLTELRDLAVATATVDAGSFGREVVEAKEAEVVRVIAAGQPAFLLDDVSREVRVIDFRYTPRGPMYQLESDRPGNLWMVPRDKLLPIAGETLLEEVNLVTGERRQVGPSE